MRKNPTILIYIPLFETDMRTYSYCYVQQIKMAEKTSEADKKAKWDAIEVWIYYSCCH